MYRIAICDDEPIFMQALNDKVIEICNNQNIANETVCFSNSKDLLYAVLTNKVCFDIFLLDVLMRELSGIDLAKKIREISDDATILFVTSTSEYAMQGYEVRAVRYLLKPIQAAALEALIKDDYNNRFLMRYITLQLETHSERIALDEILAFEIVGRKVAIYSKERTVVYAGKLSDLLALFPENVFIRTHQSYAVNIKNIKAIDRQCAITSGNKIFPISRSCLKDVQSKFLFYMGR